MGEKNRNVGLKYKHKTTDLGQIIPFTYQCVLKTETQVLMLLFYILSKYVGIK